MKKILTLVFLILSMQARSSFALEKNVVCLSEDEQNFIKTRILEDNISIAYRQCDLLEEESKNFNTLSEYFSLNNKNIVNLYKKIYSKNAEEMLNNFITENSNKASIKALYNKDDFCRKYKKILSNNPRKNIENNLKSFKIPQDNSCKN